MALNTFNFPPPTASDPQDIDDNLRSASVNGDVSALYRLIQEDRNVLKRFDEEFIDTPLHIAAAAGRIDFAMEIMILKPSFARKLNQQGLTPIHLAVEKGHKTLVLRLMENTKDLIRVKGKEGETPLHYVITREKNPLILLPRFLEDSPECIRDLTTKNRTVLHIAVRNNKEEVLKILCKMLRKTEYCQDVVNQKDQNGNTALHIAARQNNHKMIKLLLKCKADKYATNRGRLTALDVAKGHNNRESVSILHGSFISGVSAFKNMLEEQIFKCVTNASTIIFRDMDNISMEDRNALLVILGLLLTATYQTSLSPPGSVWQDDSSSNSTVTEGDDIKIPGTSVLTQKDFLVFYILTYAVFIVTFFLTLGLLKPFPRGFRTALQLLLTFLAICFDESIYLIAPTQLAPVILNMFSLFVFILMVFMCIAYRVSKISVLILGCWFFPTNLIERFLGSTGIVVGNAILGCLLFLFLYDEFWKGTILVVGYCIVLGIDSGLLKETFLALGCWLFLNLCRFCIKQCHKRRCPLQKDDIALTDE